MEKSRLLIVMDDRSWTLTALHLACAMSRRSETQVLMLKMVPVRHPLLLGTDAGSVNFTTEDRVDLADMAATAEDYGVPLDLEVCQYANYWHGVVDAAEQLRVTAVIAHIPTSRLPYWERFRRWQLSHKLGLQHQSLLSVEDLNPSLTWAPSLTLQQDLATKLKRHHT